MNSPTWCALLLAGILILASAPAHSDPLPAPLDDFVVNGDFETVLPEAAGEAICSVTGDEDVPIPPSGSPLVIINGCNMGSFKALQWSSPADTQFGDFTGDGSREARIGGTAGHNLWQAYPNPHQAYSARMDHYAFEVKESTLGTPGDWRVRTNAAVVLSLSNTPAEDQNPYVGIYLTCQLRWGGALMNAALAAHGEVRLDPLDATFTSRHESCDDAKAEWDAGTDEERLDVLGRLRVVQNSFWGFNSGGNVVVIDNVRSVGSTLAAQEWAEGNLDA